jgi:hypothetical protein
MIRDSLDVSLLRPTAGLSQRILGHLKRAIAGFPPLDRRSVLPWSGTISLLSLGLVSAESAWFSTLRGRGSVESEMRHARADGYYESLLREPAADRDRPAADRGPAPAIRPPIGWKTFADSGIMRESADYARRRLHPGLETRWNGTTFRTNSLGHRGPEIAREKPPGTFRVVVLGSSNTMGHGVEDHEAYPRKLERWLDERAGPGRDVEVVNLAVSGDSPTQRLHRLRTEAAALDPDWVLCDVTALDLSLEELHLRWVTENRAEVPFDFVSEALRESGVAATDGADEFHRKIRRFLRPLLARTFAGWAAEASRIGAPMTVVILPRADAKVESPESFRMLRDLSTRHGLRYIDLSRTFDHLSIEEYRISPWDQHPNERGHHLIFERLRRALRTLEEFEASLMVRAERLSHSSPAPIGR